MELCCCLIPNQHSMLMLLGIYNRAMKLHHLLGMQKQQKIQKKNCCIDWAIKLALYLVVFDIIGTTCDGCFITDCPSTILKKGFAKKDSENVLESPQQSANYRTPPDNFHQVRIAQSSCIYSNLYTDIMQNKCF